MSTAKATGMWQFMPTTGKHLNLNKTSFAMTAVMCWLTRAALDYLQKLYGMFGDWHLTGRHNGSEGGVGRAIAKNQRAGLGTAYTDLNMPMGALLVRKLQAIRASSTARIFQLTFATEIENRPYFQTVDIKRDIDVALADKLARSVAGRFQGTQPSASRPVILARRYTPSSAAMGQGRHFPSNLEAYGGGRLASWTAWLAPATMKPPDAARRVGMAEGHCVPSTTSHPAWSSRPDQACWCRAHRIWRLTLVFTSPTTPHLSLAADVQQRRTLIKAKKDSVASIAKRYGVSAINVAEWNQVSAQAAFKAGRKSFCFFQPRENVALKVTRTVQPKVRKSQIQPASHKAHITPAEATCQALRLS
ncbi:MAG: hypothetical protein IPH54_17860 [Rhodoferax sp.]|nr:hypothetical protein [Rhodoferax sp.]